MDQHALHDTFLAFYVSEHKVSLSFWFNGSHTIQLLNDIKDFLVKSNMGLNCWPKPKDPADELLMESEFKAHGLDSCLRYCDIATPWVTFEVCTGEQEAWDWSYQTADPEQVKLWAERSATYLANLTPAHDNVEDAKKVLDYLLICVKYEASIFFT